MRENKEIFQLIVSYVGGSKLYLLSMVITIAISYSWGFYKNGISALPVDGLNIRLCNHISKCTYAIAIEQYHYTQETISIIKWDVWLSILLKTLSLRQGHTTRHLHWTREVLKWSFVNTTRENTFALQHSLWCDKRNLLKPHISSLATLSYIPGNASENIHIYD